MLNRETKNPITDRSVRGEASGENQVMPKLNARDARNQPTETRQSKGLKIARAESKKLASPPQHAKAMDQRDP
jgi:hypothetical protein